MIGKDHYAHATTMLRTSLLATIGVGLLASHIAIAEDKLSKFLLIKLSREQSKVLCGSEGFNACMGFTQEACMELSEKALRQCIMPLADSISLAELDNDALEACPQKVYADAGYSEEKAKTCIENLPKEQP